MMGIKRKIIQVLLIIAMAISFFCVLQNTSDSKKLYSSYYVYDAYKEQGQNLTKQTVGAYFYEPRADFLCYVYDEYTEWPPEFVKYLCNSLSNHVVDIEMQKIGCEYKPLNCEEKDHIRKKYSSLEKYYMTDAWYHVNMSADGNDYVIYHETIEGYKQYFIILNEGGSDPYYDSGEVPMCAGGQKKSELYFVQWDDQKYIVVSYWDHENKAVVGLVVYDGMGNLISIGMNVDGTFQAIPQLEMYARAEHIKWLEFYSLYKPILEVY